MSIRWKLFLLLAVAAVSPMLFSRMFAQSTLREIRTELSERSLRVLTDQARERLFNTVESMARNLGANKARLEMDLRLQAAIVEGVANESLRTGGGPLPYGYMPPAGVKPLLHVLRKPEGASGASFDAAGYFRLANFWGILADYYGPMLHAGYVVLANGLVLGTNPDAFPQDFEPRASDWYRFARNRKILTWTPLSTTSPSGNEFSIVTLPIYLANGDFLGVCGFEVPMEAVLQQNDMAKVWGPEAKALIVKPHKPGHMDGTILAVLAADQATLDATCSVGPTGRYHLVNENRQELAAMQADMAEGKGGVRVLPYGDKLAIWAYKPYDAMHDTVVAVVPVESVLGNAIQASDYINARFLDFNRLTGGYALGVLGIVLLVAALASKTVTTPLARLARAATSLAKGDFTARSFVAGADEIGRLGATFDAMIPQLEERMKLKVDLSLAQEVQQNLLPKDSPELPGLDVAGASFFCEETGGDYYDFSFPTGSSAVCDVTVGDVTGHGVPAALLMATGRALLRGRGDHESDIAQLVSAVNDLLCQDTTGSGRFLTLFYLRLLGGGQPLRFVRAGHDPAILYDPATDSFSELRGGGGIPLGVKAGYNYVAYDHPPLEPGQVLFLGTDGIWEANDPNGALLGKDRLRQVLRENASRGASAIVEAVAHAVATWQGGNVQLDDITMVVIRAQAGG